MNLNNTAYSQFFGFRQTNQCIYFMFVKQSKYCKLLCKRKEEKYNNS